MTAQLVIALVMVGGAAVYLVMEILRGLREDGGCSGGRCGSCAPHTQTEEPGRIRLPQVKPPT